MIDQKTAGPEREPGVDPGVSGSTGPDSGTGREAHQEVDQGVDPGAKCKGFRVPTVGIQWTQVGFSVVAQSIKQNHASQPFRVDMFVRILL